jgi:hypothetical protein
VVGTVHVLVHVDVYHLILAYLVLHVQALERTACLVQAWRMMDDVHVLNLRHTHTFTLQLANTSGSACFCCAWPFISVLANVIYGGWKAWHDLQLDQAQQASMGVESA